MRHIALQVHGLAPFPRQLMLKQGGEANVTWRFFVFCFVSQQNQSRFQINSQVGMLKKKKKQLKDEYK